jgi:hypothetical protein
MDLVDGGTPSPVAELFPRDQAAKDSSDVDKALAKCFASEAYQYDPTFAALREGRRTTKNMAIREKTAS